MAADDDGGNAASYVAEIVETGVKYTSYTDAISAAKNSGVSQTVKLLADVNIEYSDDHELADGITLDLNGFGIKLNDSGYLGIKENTKVTITDGSEAQTGSLTAGKYQDLLRVNTTAELTVNGGTFIKDVNETNPVLLTLYGGSKIVINGGKFEAPLIDADHLRGGTIFPNGGEYKYDFTGFVPDGYVAELQDNGYYKPLTYKFELAYGDKTEGLSYIGNSVTIDFRDDATNQASWLSKVVVPLTKHGTTDVTLQKNFTNTNWNAFCAPFEITSVPDGFEIAEIWDTELVGGATTIEFKQFTSGSIAAFTPCLIRAKQTGKQDITFKGVTLTSTKGANTTIDCSSVKQKFTFTGVFENTKLVENHGWYVDAANQVLQYDFDESAYVTPFKFYMQIQNRANGEYVVPTQSAQARKVDFRVIDGGDATGISDINAAQRTADSRVYNLQGAMVGTSLDGLPAGVYVKQGRKVVVK